MAPRGGGKEGGVHSSRRAGDPADTRLLLGRGLRLEPTSRVAARKPWVPSGVRLCGRQARLAGGRPSLGGDERHAFSSWRRGSSGCADVQGGGADERG